MNLMRNIKLNMLICSLVIFSATSIHANSDIEKIISSAELDAGASPSIHASQLTHYLEQNGYILTVVKAEEDGTLTVDLGSISKITVNGLKDTTKKHVISILQKTLNETPTEKSLDRALSIINSLPGVDGTFAISKIDDVSYELLFSGVLVNQFGGISIDNPVGEIGEEYRYNIFQNFNSLLTGGDSLHLQGVFLNGKDIKDQTSLILNYQFPLGSDGAYMETGAFDFRTKSEVHGRSSSYTTGFGTVIVPGSVTSNDFEGQSYYLTSGYPLIKAHDESLYIIGQVDYASDKTDDIGESKVLHGDIGVFYTKQYKDGRSLDIGGYVGIGNSDSYVQNEDNSYTSATLVGASILPLNSLHDLTELRIEALAKIADEHLPNSKLFSLGDEDFLRGYSSGTVLGNVGAVATVEIKHAIYTQSFVRRVAPYLFLDAGFVNNSSSKANTTNRPTNHELASFGLGADFNLKNSISINSFVGIPLMEDTFNNTPNPSVYIKLNWSW